MLREHVASAAFKVLQDPQDKGGATPGLTGAKAPSQIWVAPVQPRQVSFGIHSGKKVTYCRLMQQLSMCFLNSLNKSNKKREKKVPSILFPHWPTSQNLKLPCHAFPVITRPLLCYEGFYACKWCAESKPSKYTL